MSQKHIVVIGAGPGGLTAAMLLAHRGFKVSVFEKEPTVGGRNAAIKLGDFIFDTGPTFLMMKFILDEMFAETARQSRDYLKMVKLEPMYHLKFDDMEIQVSSDHEAMKQQIDAHFPGQGKKLDQFLLNEKVRFEKLFPCLQKDYSYFHQFFRPAFLRGGPYLYTFNSIFDYLGKYFEQEKLRLSFTFQSKYLGMSAWECPGAFVIIPYIEHAFGIYHPIGGLSEISEAMARVVREEGGEIHLNTKVAKIITEGRTAKGVLLENGEKVMADEVIINQDFAHAMSHIVDPAILTKYHPDKLPEKRYSCSTFMLYLGLDKLYDFPHHCVIFAKEYRANVADIFNNLKLSGDMSFYIRNASITDQTLAPKGKSALYVLVPVANNKSGIDWEKEKQIYRNKVLDVISKRTVFTDIKEHIQVEKVTTPADWENQYNVYLGATFNLAHNIGQMLYFRPRNKFEEIDHCYLVGGGTHPGSGLPTIYESGRISANLISKRYGKAYSTPSSLGEKAM
jgi:phytoene desaturase